MRRILLLSTGVFVSPVLANWLLQCSSCVDQTYFSDEKLKADIRPANTKELLESIKSLVVQKFKHRTDEHFNKFFDSEQLGVLAQDLRKIMPSAVSQVSERRYTNAQGTSSVDKNVMMVRDSHLLFTALGALHQMAHESDAQDEVVKKHEKAIVFVKEEQELNKRKREDIMEQVLKAMVTSEVVTRSIQHVDSRFSKLEQDFALLKEKDFDDVNERVTSVEDGLRLLKEILEKEAHSDLVEKRKRAEADFEKSRVLKEIEKLRYEEEQKTILMRNLEKTKSEAAIMKLHKDKIKFEQEKKMETDMALLKEQEASAMRQHAEKAKHEKEMKQMELAQQQKNAELQLSEAIEKAKIEQEAKIRELRENEDVHARQKRLELEGQKKQVIAAIQATAKIAISWIQTLYGNPDNLMQAIGTVIGLVAAIYFTKEMAVLLREQLNKRLGRPSLVRITSRRTRVGDFFLAIKNLILRRTHGWEFRDVVLKKSLEDQVMRLANATKNAKSRNMPLLHIMFYGPPGTGKTMCAQRFAEYSGLEYAFMSGGDVAPLEEQAVTELHKLFTWVRKSRKGVLLFIDEADAFLAQRNKDMSESLRNALTTMLYHTGTPTSQFLMVLATNRPGDLDPAILDRIDESVEFGLPDVAERERMVKQYFDMYVTKPLKIKLASPIPVQVKHPSSQVVKQQLSTGDVDRDALNEAAKRIKGFSGREIAKLFTSLQTHICAHLRGASVSSRNLRLTKSTLLDVVRVKVEEHGRTIDVLARGYRYEHKEAPGSPSLLSMSGSGRLIPSMMAALEQQLKQAPVLNNIGGNNIVVNNNTSSSNTTANGIVNTCNVVGGIPGNPANKAKGKTNGTGGSPPVQHYCIASPQPSDDNKEDPKKIWFDESPLTSPQATGNEACSDNYQF